MEIIWFFIVFRAQHSHNNRQWNINSYNRAGFQAVNAIVLFCSFFNVLWIFNAFFIRLVFCDLIKAKKYWETAKENGISLENWISVMNWMRARKKNVYNWCKYINKWLPRSIFLLFSWFFNSNSVFHWKNLHSISAWCLYRWNIYNKCHLDFIYSCEKSFSSLFAVLNAWNELQ